MTIIATDGYRVAADSLATFGTCRSLKPAEKLKIEDGIVFAMSGSVPLFDPLIAWYLDGAKPDEMPKVDDDDHSTLFVFSGERQAAFYKTELPYGETVTSFPMAWGVGSEFAIGAMDAGADVENAVRIAINRSVWLGGAVQVIDLSTLQEKAA